MRLMLLSIGKPLSGSLLASILAVVVVTMR